MMNTAKTFLALTLALVMVVMPTLAVAEQVTEEVTSEYVEFEGKVLSVNKNEGKTSILVENVNNKDDQLVAHVGEDTLIFEDSKMEKANLSDIKKGEKVSLLYSKYTPVAMSLPGQLTPELIVLRNSKDLGFVKVDLFDNNLVSSANELKLNLNEDSKVVDLDGKKVELEDLKGSKLLVFYDITTKSIPAQAPTNKVILLDRASDRKVTNKEIVVINNKQIDLKSKLYETKDGVIMIPLREISEKLGYEVKWNQKDFSVEVSKGAQWNRVKIGENNYNFAKMAFELETAPELKDATTYVPVSYLNRVLALDTVLVQENGILNIK